MQNPFETPIDIPLAALVEEGIRIDAELDQPAPPRVPGNYRKRLENANGNRSLAGRQGARKSVGIPAVYVEHPTTPGEFVRVLAVPQERVRTKDKTALGLLRYEAAAEKRKRKNNKRAADEVRSGASYLRGGYMLQRAFESARQTLASA